MPFDCTPVIDPPKQFSLIAGSGVEVRFLSITAPTTTPSCTRCWYMSREAVATATAVLTKARDLISHERPLVQGNLGARLARRACPYSIAFCPTLLRYRRHLPRWKRACTPRWRRMQRA